MMEWVRRTSVWQGVGDRLGVRKREFESADGGGDDRSCP